MKNYYKEGLSIFLIGIATTIFGEYSLIMQPWQNWWQSDSPIRGVYLTFKFIIQNPLILFNGIWFGLLLRLLFLILKKAKITITVYWFVVVVFYAANFLKIKYRNEALGAADFSELQSAGNLLNMISVLDIVTVMIFALLMMMTFVVIIKLFTKKAGGIKRTGSKFFTGILMGVTFILLLLPMAFSDSFSVAVEKRMGNPDLGFSSSARATINGPIWYFFRSLDARKQLMNRPDDYSEKTMNSIQRKYLKIANQINLNRTHADLKNQTVIFVLSESLTNPERVPGLELKRKVVPNLEKIQKQNAGGTMISSGLGGGTANVEYMALTGMPVAGFKQTITTPYSQVVPTQKYVPSILNHFDNTETVHPFNGSFYNRRGAYRVMGMQKFITTDNADSKEDSFKYKDKLSDKSDYIDDKSAFRELEDRISPSRTTNSQFIQLISMQNHLPYTPKMYLGSDYKNFVDNALPGNKVQDQVETYLNGIHETDKQLPIMLKKLDNVHRPITMVFYGDHWPGIFTFVNSQSNEVTEHSTDYFIWQNKAAKSVNGTALVGNDTVSPTTFSAQLLEATNVKVTPYMALQTEMLKKVPAIANFVRTQDGSFEFTKGNGKLIDENELTTSEKTIVRDLKLVQFDSIQKKGFLKKSFYKLSFDAYQ